MRRRNKWLKAMSIALSCAMLATNVPMNVLATEVSAVSEVQNVTVPVSLDLESDILSYGKYGTWKENVPLSIVVNGVRTELKKDGSSVNVDFKNGDTVKLIVSDDIELYSGTVTVVDSVVSVVADKQVFGGVKYHINYDSTSKNVVISGEYSSGGGFTTGVSGWTYEIKYDLTAMTSEGTPIQGITLTDNTTIVPYYDYWEFPSHKEWGNGNSFSYEVVNGEATNDTLIKVTDENGYTDATMPVREDWIPNMGSNIRYNNPMYYGICDTGEVYLNNGLVDIDTEYSTSDGIPCYATLESLGDTSVIGTPFVDENGILGEYYNIQKLYIAPYILNEESVILKDEIGNEIATVEINNFKVQDNYYLGGQNGDFEDLLFYDTNLQMAEGMDDWKVTTSFSNDTFHINAVKTVSTDDDTQDDTTQPDDNIKSECIIYDEEVEIRYLADDDKNRIIELLGLSEYDGKVICIDSERERDSYQHINSSGSGYGYDYDILRTDNGDLTLGYNRIKDNSSYLAFSGTYKQYDDVKLTISYGGDNVWLLCCGDVESSGLKFTDKVEKTKIVEPFAKRGSGGTISKSFEREFEAVLAGTLSEQDKESVGDYFGVSSYSGELAIIPTEGSEYKIDFEKSSYEKDELYQIEMVYYALSRDEDGSLNIERLNFDVYSFVNGKRDFSAYYDAEMDDYGKFLTKGDFGTDIEDCEFYIPAMDENSDEVILMFVNLGTLNGRWSGNLMVYNDEKTLEVCNFVEVKEVEDEEENTTPNDSYEVTLPADKTTISKSDFAAVLEENKTKDVVIKSNNNITFTFKAGTMSAVENKENYDFGTKVVSDFTNAGNMGSSVTKDNFVTRINYNYSGKLPATATIKIFVGTDYANQTLYYSKIVEDGFKLIQSVKVDKDGYITVSQDSCSDYVVTTNELTTTTPDDTNKPEDTQKPSDTNKSQDTQKPEDNKNDDTTSSSPDTGDQNNIVTYMTMLICGVGALFVAMQKKRLNK